MIGITMSVLLTTIFGGFIFYRWFQEKGSNSGELASTQTNDILFEKDEGWGPCPPGRVCSQTATLYGSGKLTLKGDKNYEKTLSKNLVDQVIIQIRQTGIMNKSCETPTLPDYSATYKINLDGQEKTIRFPGCENELKRIEDLFLEN